MIKNNFLIYGSYGYTGKLIAELACQQGLKPVLGGRNKDKVIEQAKLLNLDYRVFDVNNLAATIAALKEFVCVIHCAGPFIDTYKNMAEACIETQTHYLDITGEVEVIENLSKMDTKAQAANIMILPGAGFDVVPSDCLAQHLKNRLPNATELILAIKAKGPHSGPAVSRGTAKTMLKGFSAGTMIRDGGVLKKVSSGNKRFFDFGDHKKTVCTTIAWGDLASAWWSTRIPHIETYMAIPPKLSMLLKLISPFTSFLSFKPIRQFLEGRIEKMPEGPTDAMRKQSSSHIYGEANNATGEKVISLLSTPEGYDCTARTALLITTKILANGLRIGFQTPSTAYGENLILEIPHVKRQDL